MGDNGMSGPFENAVPGRYVDRTSAGGLRSWKRNEDRPDMVEDGPNKLQPIFDPKDSQMMFLAKLTATLQDLFQKSNMQGEAIGQIGRIVGGISSDDIGIEVDPVSKRSHWKLNKQDLAKELGFNVRGTKALFKGVFLRAYYNSTGALVAANVAYSASTMKLYPTWDYPRAHE